MPFLAFQRPSEYKGGQKLEVAFLGLLEAIEALLRSKEATPALRMHS